MQGRPLSQVYGIRLFFEPRVQRIGLFALLAVILAIRAYQLVGLSGEFAWGYDQANYWRAGHRILSGTSVYQPFQLAGPYPPQGITDIYLYPPFLAVVVAPLVALVPDGHAGNWLWMAIGAVILALGVLSTARREGLARGFDLALLLAAIFAYAPVVSEMIIGNVDLEILGLLTAAWLAVRSGSERGDLLAGGWVALATVIKVFPGIMILWFLLTGRYRAAGAAVVTMVLLILVTLPVTGLQLWSDYPVVLANLGPPVEFTDVLAPSAWLSVIMPPLAARALVTAVGIAVVIWAARRRSAPISFAVTVVVSVLIGPSLFPHYLAMLVLPMLLAIRYAPPMGWVGLVWLSALGGGAEVFGDATWIVNRAIPTLGALALVVGLAWFGRHGDRSMPAAEQPGNRDLATG